MGERLDRSQRFWLSATGLLILFGLWTMAAWIELAMFNRGAQPSRADGSMNAIAEFMKEIGSLRADEARPEPKGYVTDEFLKLIDRDATLKAFANRTN